MGEMVLLIKQKACKVSYETLLPTPATCTSDTGRERVVSDPLGPLGTLALALPADYMK